MPLHSLAHQLEDRGEPGRRSYRPLSILYAGTLPPHPGGTAIVGEQLLTGFARRGHRVRAVAPITAEALRAGDRFAGLHPEILTLRFVVPYFEVSPNHPAPAEYRRAEATSVRQALHALVPAERPDVIVIGRESFAWHVPGVADGHKVPAVALIHGAGFHGLLNGTMSERDAGALLAGLRAVDQVIAVAHHLAESLRSQGVAGARVVPNGVDLRRFAPASRKPALIRDLAIESNDVVVVHASNLKDLKRPLDIVLSAEQALRHNPNLLYVIVGDGPLRPHMEEACSAKGLRHRFRFVGWVDHDQMPDHLNLADLVLMPSECEGLALLYLESLACGRVLLASDVPAVREVVQDGHNGVLFRRGDIADLTAKTLRLARDHERRARIGARARSMAKPWALEHTVSSYLSIFAELVAGPGRRIAVRDDHSPPAATRPG